MNTPDTKAFLELIVAPWAAYHDHPTPAVSAGIAFIRPTGEDPYNDDVCTIYGCDSLFEGYSEKRLARRDLIVQAPRMYAYIASMAATGDTEAKLILRAIHGADV